MPKKTPMRRCVGCMEMKPKASLTHLPHVNEDTAEEIIELREKLERFSHTYELLYVDSLTQSEVADILGYVTVE